MEKPNDFIIVKNKVDINEDIQYYIQLIKTKFEKFIISKEYGTLKDGLHYHLLIYSVYTKETIRKRLRECITDVKFRSTKEPVRDELRAIAYTIKDGTYEVIGEVPADKIEDAKKISFQKDKPKSKTMKSFKQEIEDLYLADKIVLWEAHEMYTRYNLDEVESSIQQQQRDYFFQRIILKKDERLRKAYVNSEYRKSLKWISYLENYIDDNESEDTNEEIRRTHGYDVFEKYPL